MEQSQPNECEIHLPRFHDKQLYVYNSPATNILFAGDTRAGKSYFVRRALIEFCSQIPGLLCKIFRLHESDVIAENMYGSTGFPVLLHNWIEAGLCKVNQTEVIFTNGARIMLCHCHDDIVMQQHQGNPAHVLVFGESCQIEEHRIRALMGWVTMDADMRARVPEQWKGRFPRIYHVTNPHGISNAYYCREFVDARDPYAIERVGAFTYQYIPAFIDDNPSEDKEAAIGRVKAAFGNEEVQKSLINEDKSGISNWHANIGNFFKPFSRTKHVIPTVRFPYHWLRYRSFDWGSAAPFCCLWWTVSDGVPFECSEVMNFPPKYRLQVPLNDTLQHCVYIPRGTRIVYREWYGCNPLEPDKGLSMSNVAVAEGILERSTYKEDRNITTLCDTKPFQAVGGVQGWTPSRDFETAGIPLQMADTNRKSGWSVVNSAFIGTEEYGPELLLCDCCKWGILLIPQAQHDEKDPEDLVCALGDHYHDTLRYGATAKKVVFDAKNVDALTMMSKTKGDDRNMRSILAARGSPIPGL